MAAPAIIQTSNNDVVEDFSTETILGGTVGSFQANVTAGSSIVVAAIKDTSGARQPSADLRIDGGAWLAIPQEVDTTAISGNAAMSIFVYENVPAGACEVRVKFDFDSVGHFCLAYEVEASTVNTSLTQGVSYPDGTWVTADGYAMRDAPATFPADSLALSWLALDFGGNITGVSSGWTLDQLYNGNDNAHASRQFSASTPGEIGYFTENSTNRSGDTAMLVLEAAGGGGGTVDAAATLGADAGTGQASQAASEASTTAGASAQVLGDGTAVADLSTTLAAEVVSAGDAAAATDGAASLAAIALAQGAAIALLDEAVTLGAAAALGAADALASLVAAGSLDSAALLDATGTLQGAQEAAATLSAAALAQGQAEGAFAAVWAGTAAAGAQGAAGGASDAAATLAGAAGAGQAADVVIAAQGSLAASCAAAADVLATVTGAVTVQAAAGLLADALAQLAAAADLGADVGHSVSAGTNLEGGGTLTVTATLTAIGTVAEAEYVAPGNRDTVVIAQRYTLRVITGVRRITTATAGNRLKD